MANDPVLNPSVRVEGGGAGGSVDPASARQVTLEAIRDREDFPLPAAQVEALTPFEPPEVYPVIGTVALDPATLAALETTTVNVSFPGTQPVSGTMALDSATLAALETTGVAVSNFPATQTIAGTVTANVGSGTQPVSGTVAVSNLPASPTVYDPSPATLAVSATAAVNTLTTATLPAVAGQFHYITAIQVVAYATAARTGGTTPTIATTTNLPGSPAFTFPSAQAVGTLSEQRFDFPVPLKSSVANTATTIVGPQTASVIWRINVFYRTGA